MSKQISRYRRDTRFVIDEWPQSLAEPDVVAERVRYVGSAEHKDYPSYAGDPALRSDASRCDPTITCEQAEAVLKRAIRLRCISAQHEGGFPRYVWGWFAGRLYQARLINREQGWYKGWPIEEVEAPLDRHARLKDEGWHD